MDQTHIAAAGTALTVALALAGGVLIQCLARTVRVPAIILLLTTGVIVGPTVLGWVRPDELGGGLYVLVDFAVSVILFEGALNLEVRRLRREEKAIRRLVTWGALVTLAGAAVAAWAWMGWEWPRALLFGSLVVVTGPTVVGPLVRDLRLRPKVRTVLEAEGVLIDPIGAILAVLVLQLTLSPNALVVASEGAELLLRLTVGIGLGVLGGLTIALLLRLPQFVHGLENILTLALVMLLFFLAEHIVGQSGLLAVTTAGLTLGNLEGTVDEDLREFKDQLTILMVGAVFILLAADIGLAEVVALGLPGVAVLLSLVFVVRPLGVWLSTAGTDLDVRQRGFIAAIAPRGIVAAAIASLTAEALDARGIAGGGEELRALVFLVIAGTVVLAGATAYPLARLLGVRLASRDCVAILGAQGLGLALAGRLKQAGATVVFVDTDPQNCRAAGAEGFGVVFGNGLQDRTLRRIPIELVGTAIGLTFNDHLNSQFAALASETFGVGAVFVSVDALDAGRAPDHVTRHGARVLFEEPDDQERWDVRWRQREVAVEEFEFRPEAAESEGAARDSRATLEPKQEAFVILTAERGNKVAPMSLGHPVKAGDRAAVAYFVPWREQALAQLAAAGWRRAAPAEPSESAET